MQEMEQVFARALRPARSVAFEQLSETLAIAKHPELKTQYEILRHLQGDLLQRFPADRASRETYTAAFKDYVIGHLDSGKLLTVASEATKSDIPASRSQKPSLLSALDR